jgi:hypothetical protein
LFLSTSTPASCYTVTTDGVIFLSASSPASYYTDAIVDVVPLGLPPTSYYTDTIVGIVPLSLLTPSYYTGVVPDVVPFGLLSLVLLHRRYHGVRTVCFLLYHASASVPFYSSLRPDFLCCDDASN